ncbi:MAG: tetraacyldisaccharide 4'-kinase, partial [Gammaproteobacteria bacterium]|nr:tetraacyldisaccharide 4'-kinase [Gammaproteobacteria bacterium]
DEPVLLAQRSGCPVVAGPIRVAAADLLLEVAECDVIVSDDGLQHHALHRDLEIVVLDAQRRHGNRRCLPVGPLREPVARLQTVDAVVANGEGEAGEFSMQMVNDMPRRLLDASVTRCFADFATHPVHAVAGIGHPGRFFAALRAQGLRVIEHPFDDHHRYCAADLDFGDAFPILMTEKDAVKCVAFATEHCWCVPVRAELEADFVTWFDDSLQRIHLNGAVG